MRLGQVVRIGGGAVTHDFAENFCVATFGRIQGFNRQHRRTFAEGEAVAMRVERPASGGRERLQRIEPAENHLADGVVAAGKHALDVAAPNQIPRMPDGIRAGSAGVRDDGDRTGEAEGFADIERLALRLVALHARGLAAIFFGRADGLAIIRFAQSHAAAGRPEHEWEIFRSLPAGLLPGFIRREKEHFRGSIQAALVVRQNFVSEDGFGHIHLRAGFGALAGDVEERDGAHRGFAGAKALCIGAPAKSQSRHDPGAGNDDARLSG